MTSRPRDARPAALQIMAAVLARHGYVVVAPSGDLVLPDNDQAADRPPSTFRRSDRVPLTDRIDFALTRIGRPAEIGEVRAVVAALYGTPISRQTMSTVLNDMARAGFVTRENAGPGHPTLWASPRPVNP